MSSLQILYLYNISIYVLVIYNYKIKTSRICLIGGHLDPIPLRPCQCTHTPLSQSYRYRVSSFEHPRVQLIIRLLTMWLKSSLVLSPSYKHTSNASHIDKHLYVNGLSVLFFNQVTISPRIIQAMLLPLITLQTKNDKCKCVNV